MASVEVNDHQEYEEEIQWNEVDFICSSWSLSIRRYAFGWKRWREV